MNPAQCNFQFVILRRDRHAERQIEICYWHLEFSLGFFGLVNQNLMFFDYRNSLRRRRRQASAP